MKPVKRMRKPSQQLRLSRETVANLGRIELQAAVAGHITNVVSCLTECVTNCPCASINAVCP